MKACYRPQSLEQRLNSCTMPCSLQVHRPHMCNGQSLGTSNPHMSGRVISVMTTAAARKAVALQPRRLPQASAAHRTYCSSDHCLGFPCHRQVLLTGPPVAQNVVWGSRTTSSLSQGMLSPKKHKPKRAHSPEWKGLLGHAHSCCKALALQPGCSPWPSAADRPCCACSSCLWLVHDQLLSENALIHVLQILDGQDGLIGPLLILQAADKKSAITPILSNDEGYIYGSRLGITHQELLSQDVLIHVLSKHSVDFAQGRPLAHFRPTSWANRIASIGDCEAMEGVWQFRGGFAAS